MPPFSLYLGTVGGKKIGVNHLHTYVRYLHVVYVIWSHFLGHCYHEQSAAYDPVTELWSSGPNTRHNMNLFYNCALNLRAENEPEIFVLGHGHVFPFIFNFDTGAMSEVWRFFRGLPRNYPRSVSKHYLNVDSIRLPLSN